jgi:hypothetical protein
LDKPLHVILSKSKLAYRIYVILIANKELKKIRTHPFHIQNHASIIKTFRELEASSILAEIGQCDVSTQTQVLWLFLYGINYKWVIYHMSLLTRTEQREMRRNCLWASLECTAIKVVGEVDAPTSPKIYCFNSKEK